MRYYWSLARIVSVGVWLFLFVGCQFIPSPPPQSTPPAVTSAGHLAYIAGDGNVYVTTANREQTVPITTDATTFSEGEGLSYHRLAWSPSGQLAFAAMQRQADAFQSQLYTIDTLDSPPRLVGENDENFVIYLYWAPASCGDQSDCHRLAYLIEDGNRIALRMVKLTGQQVANEFVGRGKPFYFGWSPNGQQMLWHTGGAQRHSNRGLLRLYDVEQDQLEELPVTTGLFFAPAWSPNGQDWLGVLADDTLDQLHLFDQTNQPLDTLVTNEDGQIVYVWSPDGQQVAYALREGLDPIFGPIHILDLASGEVKVVTKQTDLIFSFFWSPDGQKIAYLMKLLPEEARLQWRIYDLPTNTDRGYAAFTPSFQMQFMASSFNQYAQSHRFWSPDSRYLVYANRDRRRVERVWLIDTWIEDQAEPILVSEGSIGVWSWQ